MCLTPRTTEPADEPHRAELAPPRGDAGPTNTGPSATLASATAEQMRRAAVRGSLWTAAGFGLGQILRLGSNIVLAAVLYQEAFALMALVGAIVQGLVMFSDIGIGPAIVQNPRGDDPRFLNTAWTLQVVRGAALALIATALAWPLAAFYEQNDPQAGALRTLLPIVALGTLIEGFQSTKLRTAARHIRLGRITLVELTSQVLGLVAIVGLALWTRSVYALALGSLVSMVTHAILSHVAFPGVANRFCWDPASARAVLRFGRWVFVSTVVTFFALQLDKLVFARMLPLDEVGVYAIAANLAMLAPTLLGRLQHMVAFPLYARMMQLHLPLDTAVRKTKLPMLIAGGYLVALMIACGDSFVRLLYDERYRAAGLYLPLLAVASWFALVEGIYGAALLASDRAQWVAAFNAARVTIFAGLVVPMIHAFGLVGAVVAIVLADLAKASFAMIVGRVHGLTRQWVEIAFSVFVAAVGLGAVALVRFGPSILSTHAALEMGVEWGVVTLAFAPLCLRAVRQVRLASVTFGSPGERISG